MPNQMDFLWELHPKAEALLQGWLDTTVKANNTIAKLSDDLEQISSTRLLDWIDHLAVPDSGNHRLQLTTVGFIEEQREGRSITYHHPGAMLPRVVVNEDTSTNGVAVKVDSIAEFLMVRGLSLPIEGDILSGYRRCCISKENGVSLWVVERRGSRTMQPTSVEKDHLSRYLQASEKWQTRPRGEDDEENAMRQTLKIADDLISLVGRDMAACIVLDCERRYWQARNLAGQIQKARQDRLGMGWANHDHHTFRSSRRHFRSLVLLFEKLGFHCRERFYAGKQAGWGAQVMENSQSGLVLFLDLDLTPEEVAVDFAHQELPEPDQLGTVGLWCALHGDSILQAGMHHLEAQFQFDRLTHDLAQAGVQMMEPFSNFPFLRQAFTKGEVWQVKPERVNRLLQMNQISSEQADKFLHFGAIGSHLENLQRREGFKGFNQENVSEIIRKTDPRVILQHRDAF